MTLKSKYSVIIGISGVDRVNSKYQGIVKYILKLHLSSGRKVWLKDQTDIYR